MSQDVPVEMMAGKSLHPKLPPMSKCSSVEVTETLLEITPQVRHGFNSVVVNKELQKGVRMQNGSEVRRLKSSGLYLHPALS